MIPCNTKEIKKCLGLYKNVYKYKLTNNDNDLLEYKLFKYVLLL